MALQSFYPVVMAEDVEASVRFYAEHMGFETTFESDWYVSLKHRENPAYELAVLSPKLEGGLVAAGLLDAELSVLERWSLFVYEPWFFAGGILYGLSARRYGRRSRSAVVTSSEGKVAGAARDRRQGWHRK